MILSFVIIGSVLALINEKRPREFAHDFLMAKTKEERQAVADSVPAHLKNMVKLHIKITKDRRRMINVSNRN